MARGYGYARSRPSMNSYIQFAWRDAMALADLMHQEWDPIRAHADFSARGEKERGEAERLLREEVYDLIRATESKRPGMLRRIQRDTKRHDIPELVLLFAIMAQKRAMSELERLTPGGGNRDTCAICYAQEATRSHVRVVHQFPYDVFEAMGLWIDFGEDDED